MLAVEECELTSQLESKRDTLTDSEAALFQRYQEVERSGAIPAVDSDENAEPTIPSARCPTWDIHEQGKTRQQHSQFGLAQNYAQQQVIR